MKCGVYKHYKGGKYLVIGISADASDDSDGSEYVTYISLDATQSGPRLRQRRLSEFMGHIDIKQPGGTTTIRLPRYEFVGDMP